jgi:hypothetical protein
MPSRLNVGDRDGRSCVCCGQRLDTGHAQASQHHRILGDRTDNRPSNGLLLQGTGSSGHHWRWHIPDRLEAERLGYIIRRGVLAVTTAIPVFYRQPNLGRVGWYLLDDHGRVTPTAHTDPGLDALDLMETLWPHS